MDWAAVGTRPTAATLNCGGPDETGPDPPTAFRARGSVTDDQSERERVSQTDGAARRLLEYAPGGRGLVTTTELAGTALAREPGARTRTQQTGSER
jgi:hypothetical protein